MNAPVIHDQSGIVALVDRARALLDEGDVIRARMIAAEAYAQADRAVVLAGKVRASEELMDKARRMQADALLIESRCKIGLANLWDQAHEAGLISKGGRPSEKPVSDGNGFSAEEAGLSRKEIHEARRLRDAERREPGIVERAVAARIEAGLRATRGAVNHAIGTKTATREERGNNLYETPREGIATLLALEPLLPLVLEPSCGRGAISSVLEEAGHEVILSDLVDYGTADRHGQVQQVRDFLALTRDEVLAWADGEDFDLVTNPPYGDRINAYIAHALTEIRPRKLALLVNLNFLCGCEDDARNRVLDQMSPERAIIMARRLPMMHRDGWDGDKASSQMNTVWLVWERRTDGVYAGDFRIVRADWRDYADAAPLGPISSPPVGEDTQPARGAADGMGEVGEGFSVGHNPSPSPAMASPAARSALLSPSGPLSPEIDPLDRLSAADAAPAQEDSAQ